MPNGDSGYAGTRPKLGFKPKLPQNAAGMRTLPAPSVPTDSGPMPAATAAAVPPDEPPGVLLGSQGLRVMPVQRRIGLALAAELGRAGLAEQHRAGLAQARAGRRVDVPRLVGVDGAAAAQRRPALGEDQVLDRRRHAVERTDRLAPLPARFAGARRGDRVGRREVAERQQLRVDAFDARQHRVRRFDRRGLLGAIERAAARWPCSRQDRWTGREHSCGGLLARAARQRGGLFAEVPEHAGHHRQRLRAPAARAGARWARAASRPDTMCGTHTVGRPRMSANTSFGSEPPRLGSSAGCLPVLLLDRAQREADPGVVGVEPRRGHHHRLADRDVAEAVLLPGARARARAGASAVGADDEAQLQRRLRASAGWR